MRTLYPSVEKINSKWIPEHKMRTSFRNLKCRVCGVKFSKTAQDGVPVIYRIRLSMSTGHYFYICPKCIRNMHKTLSGVIQTDFEPLFEVHEK